MSSRWVVICLCYICSRGWRWGWWDVIQQCPWLQAVLWSITFPVPTIVVHLTYGVNYRRVSNICPFFDTGPAFWQNIFFPLLFTHKYFIPSYLMQISLNRKNASEKKCFCMFFTVVSSFICTLRKGSVLFCDLTSIFSHSFLLLLYHILPL